MAWDDWLFGALTGGLYNVGKTAYKAGEAADQAGTAIEEISDGAGTALAAIGSTVTKLGKDLSSFLKELEELITIQRVAPRSEDDLWDEEVERLKALRKSEEELVAALEAVGGQDTDTSWIDSFWGSIFGGVSYAELELRTKLAVVRNAINEILYEEPGVIPTGVHNLNQILERFNTLEQPRVEKILDSVDDNLDSSNEVMQEVKKLFVIKTWRAVAVADITAQKHKEMEVLEASLLRFDHLIAKNTTVVGQLQQAMLEAHPAEFQMVKNIGRQFKVSGALAPGAPPAGAAFAVAAAGGTAAGTSLPVGPSARLASPLHGEALAMKVWSGGPSVALKGKVSTIAAQPMGLSVASALNQNAVSAYLGNFQAVDGRLRFYERERLKIEKAIWKIKWVPVEEPGVIPKILEEVRSVLARFRTENQPRVEGILDSVNTNLQGSAAVLTSVNKSLGSLQGALDFLSKYSLVVKIGAAASGVLWVLILLLSVVVLFRAAIGV
jgi:hypothetical protein